MPQTLWTSVWPHVRKILVQAEPGTTIPELLPDIQSVAGKRIKRSDVQDAIRRFEGMGAKKFIGSEQTAVLKPEPVKSVVSDAFDDLMLLTRKGVSFNDLCDKLDLSPKRARALIKEAQDAGRDLRVDGDTVQWETSDPASDDGETVKVPVRQIDGWHRFAVISDTHFGSKFAMRKQLKDFLAYARDKRGCDTVLHVGDWTQGIHPKVMGELSHHNFHDQMRDMHEHLPHDMQFTSIYGNHDAWHARDNGMNVARAMNDTLRGFGRSNVQVVGGMNKLLQIGGLRVRLTHPAGGTAYAKSYPAQKWTRDLASASGRKPHVWLFGHRHRYVHFVDRGMHVIDVPCWQGGGSDFGKRLHGDPAIGGLILSVGQLDNGIVRALTIEPVLYYEAEEAEVVPVKQLRYEVVEPGHLCTLGEASCQ